MNKKFLFSMAIVALAAGSFRIIRFNQSSDSKLSPLQMQNIEALTSTENSSAVMIQCLDGYAFECAARCNNCFRKHVRSSGVPGLCVAVQGACGCGHSSFTRLSY